MTKPVKKAYPWDDYTKSTPVEDIRGCRESCNKFSILFLTTESYNTLLDHPNIVYRGRHLESTFDVDCIVKGHEDAIIEYDVHTLYIHTGSRRFLKT